MKTSNCETITPHFTEFGKLILPNSASLHVKYNLNRNMPMPQFCYSMSGDISNILSINSAAALKLYYLLLHNLAKQKETGSIVIITSDSISKQLKIDLPAVSRALKLLQDNNLVITKTRKSIKLSPRYAWRGNLRPWQEEVALMNLKEMEDELNKQEF